MIEPYLARRFGDALSREIDASTHLSHEDAVARFRPLYGHDASGIGADQPANYWYKEVGYFWRVQGFAESRTLDGDDRAATLLVMHATPLGCRVPWRVAIAAVRAILGTREGDKKREGRSSTMAATSDDGAYGFVFTSHVGYVVRELHDDETVYKVSRWHPLSA